MLYEKQKDLLYGVFFSQCSPPPCAQYSTPGQLHCCVLSVVPECVCNGHRMCCVWNPYDGYLVAAASAAPYFSWPGNIIPAPTHRHISADFRVSTISCSCMEYVHRARGKRHHVLIV